MGDINQFILVSKYARNFAGPYLEVGAKNYGNTQDLRSLFAGKEQYIGLDMEEGPGVDMVLDLTQEFEQIDEKIGHMRFGTIFCLSVLEHCVQPFIIADHLTRLLKPHGKVCISVPFSWKYHGYPSDYWRFTHDGIKLLFPGLDFNLEDGFSVTSKQNEFKALDQEIGKISFSTSKHWNSGHILRGVSAKVLKLLSRFGILSWLTGYRYVLAPTNIFMIGTLKDVE